MIVRPLGLAALALLGCATEPPPAEPPTWSDAVAPLVEARCSACHREGGVAPFAIRTYEDARSRSDDMAFAVASGIMPPDPPDRSGACAELAPSPRRLAPEAVDTLVAWDRAGAPEGAPGRVVTPLDPPRLEGARVLRPAASYTPSTEAEDDYRCFLLDPELEEDAFVTAFEARPGDRRIVHHAILFAVPDAEVEAVTLVVYMKLSQQPSTTERSSTSSGPMSSMGTPRAIASGSTSGSST